MSAGKISKTCVDASSSVWQQNLKDRVTRRSAIPLRPDELFHLSRMPLKRDIIGRFLGLFEAMKEKKVRIKKIADEICILWNKLNFPLVSSQRIIFKLTKLCNAYVDYRKKNNRNLENQLRKVFDVTKQDGTWLCSEDKQLYRSQTQSNGTIGYTTTKLAPSSSIHPSKRRRIVDKVTVMVEDKDDLSDNNSLYDDADKCSNDPDFQPNEEYSRRKYQSTKSAAHLVTNYSLSTRQASRVCRMLSNEGADPISTPSQTGVWKRVIKDGKEMKSKIINILKNDTDFCLHFDGKRIMSKEYVVVCLKSPSRSLNLGVIGSDSGTVADVFIGLKNLLNEFEA